MNSVSISFEALIVIVVIVSTTIVGGVALALYWLWRMLKYDLNNPDFQQCVLSPEMLLQDNLGREVGVVARNERQDGNLADAEETMPLTNKNNVTVKPFAKEENMLRSSFIGCDNVRTIRLESQDSRWSIPDGWTLEEVVIVLDGTEPPPPYLDGGSSASR